MWAEGPRIRPAQGNALGKRAISPAVRPNGPRVLRSIGPLGRQHRFRGPQFPRALPWAGRTMPLRGCQERLSHPRLPRPSRSWCCCWSTQLRISNLQALPPLGWRIFLGTRIAWRRQGALAALGCQRAMSGAKGRPGSALVYINPDKMPDQKVGHRAKAGILVPFLRPRARRIGQPDLFCRAARGYCTYRLCKDSRPFTPPLYPAPPLPYPASIPCSWRFWPCRHSAATCDKAGTRLYCRRTFCR
jgi:hypothetical protein